MRTIPALATLTLAAAACGGADPGTIEVTVYGEDFIEEAIPSDVFNDGWTVTFDKFLLSIGGVATSAGHDGEQADPTFKIFDLAQASDGGHLLATFVDAPGGTYDHFGYVFKPVAGATAGNAAADDVAALVAAGQSVRVVGTATKGSQTITFDWGFAPTVTHSHCDPQAEVDGNTVTIQATIHGDHLFYDDLVSEEPNVSFDLVAASDGADGSVADGVVTPAELAAKDITGETRYQVGSNDVDDLWGFISHQVGTLGHLNGEGHCEDILVTGG